AGITAAASSASPDPAGNWPTVVGGVSVTVAGLPATVIGLTPAPDITSTVNSYRVDFVVPDALAAGNNVPVTVTYLPANLSWVSTVNVVDSAPALVAAGGTAVGDALAED